MIKYENTPETNVLKLLENFTGKEIFSSSLEHLRPIFNKYYKKIKVQKIITIAGSNGKGQVAMQLHAIVAKFRRVATFISPHVVTIRERILTNDGPIDYSSFDNLFYQVKEKLIDVKVSFYELLFLMFCEYVSQNAIDIIILEVGLGGRLDAVNLFDADIAVITSISRDHQSILGNSYEQILHEKLPVARKLLITSLELKYLRRLVAKYCNGKISWYDLYQINDEFKSLNYFDRNAFMALHIFNKLDITFLKEDEIPKINFPGRFERFKNLILVGAHNPDGVRKMIGKILQDKIDFQFILAAFSNRDIADINCMISSLKYLKVEINLTTFNHFKAWTIPISDDETKWIVDWQSYILKKKGIGLITGSFYFIGEVKKFLS